MGSTIFTENSILFLSLIFFCHLQFNNQTSTVETIVLVLLDIIEYFLQILKNRPFFKLWVTLLDNSNSYQKNYTLTFLQLTNNFDYQNKYFKTPNNFVYFLNSKKNSSLKIFRILFEININLRLFWILEELSSVFFATSE